LLNHLNRLFTTHGYQLTLWYARTSLPGSFHIRGELLAGLATTAQRTGRIQEMDLFLDKIFELMKDTPYESVARQWKKNPEAAGKIQLTCLTCHDAGRLTNRMSELGNK